jgi:hypothetical protein
MRLRAERREVLPNMPASLRSDSGLPVWRLARYAATATAIVSLKPTSDVDVLGCREGAWKADGLPFRVLFVAGVKWLSGFSSRPVSTMCL